MCAVMPERFLPLWIQRCRVRYDTYYKEVTRAVFHLERSALKEMAPSNAELQQKREEVRWGQQTQQRARVHVSILVATLKG